MRKLIFAIMIMIVFAFPINVNADAAPPPQPPGSNLEPGTETTQVRMVAETVNITIFSNTPADSMGRARVSADFTMRNLGTQSESMAVRFPLGHETGSPTWKEIKDIVVKVDNQTVPIRITEDEGYDSYFGIIADSPWAVFDVTFPTDRDVLLQVAYTLEAGGEMPFVEFDYIFATGEGWKDTIGSATLNVVFPYEVSNLNVLPDYSGRYDAISHQSGPNQLTWVYTDFEPQLADNFVITLVAPSVWNDVLREKSILTTKPNDGEAWGRLGMLYKRIAFSSRSKGFRTWSLSEDKGAQELIRLSIEAYQNAVTLKPNDPLWHAGFADLLGYYALWAGGFEGMDTRSEAYDSLIQIQSALELAPEDPIVQDIAESLVYELDGGLVKDGDSYQFPWLTATPMFSTQEVYISTETPAPTKQPTIEQSIATSIPKGKNPTDIPPTVQQSGKGISICGSILFAPIGLILWLSRRKIG